MIVNKLNIFNHLYLCIIEVLIFIITDEFLIPRGEIRK
jgi:hypothetical protein